MGKKKLCYSRLISMSGGVQRRGSPVRVPALGVHFSASLQK